ncbi:MAG: hypothetical protein HS107_05045 [Thermoflexaceae bacterium]|nr:hypothetical protein [Thermoflexaceae bacterium]
MSFSRIVPLAVDVPASPGDAGRDPLFDRWEALKEARAVPFDSRNPAHWQERFTVAVARAASALRDHVYQVEGERTPLEWALKARVGGQVMVRQFAEHLPLKQKVERVLSELRALRMAGLPRVIDLSEQIVELEIAVARHHNRLREILNGAEEPLLAAAGAGAGAALPRMAR